MDSFGYILISVKIVISDTLELLTCQMRLSFEICSNSLANPLQCLSPISIFLGLSYYFERIFHNFDIFFIKI